MWEQLWAYQQHAFYLSCAESPGLPALMVGFLGCVADLPLVGSGTWGAILPPPPPSTL